MHDVSLSILLGTGFLAALISRLAVSISAHYVPGFALYPGDSQVFALD